MEMPINILGSLKYNPVYLLLFFSNGIGGLLPSAFDALLNGLLLVSYVAHAEFPSGISAEMEYIRASGSIRDCFGSNTPDLDSGICL